MAIDVVVLVLMVADMTLGNIVGFYFAWPYYDKVLHLGSSVLIGLLGFLAIYIVHITGRIRFHGWLDGLEITTSIVHGTHWTSAATSPVAPRLPTAPSPTLHNGAVGTRRT